MTNFSESNRFVIEIGVIVASILLAFSIEAWWSDRTERASELTLLQSLHEDLVGKTELYTQQHTQNIAILNSATTLLQAGQSDNPDLSIEDTNHHLFNLLWWQVPSDYISAPLNTLMSGGNAHRITNQELLKELVLLESSLGFARVQAERDQAVRFDTITPFLIANGHLLHINLDGGHAPGFPEFTWDFPQISTNEKYDHRSFLSNVEFQNVLSVAINRKVNLNNAYPELQVRLGVTIALLEEELK